MSTKQITNSTDVARWIDPAHFSEELLIQIFAGLFREDMSRVVLVNHHWSSIGSRSSLLNFFIYRLFLPRDFPRIRLDEKTNYKARYEECIRLERAFKSGKCIPVSLSKQEISCVEITNDLLCLGSTAGEVNLCDLKTKEEWTLPDLLNGAIRTIKTQPGYLCAGTNLGTLSVWNLKTRERLPIPTFATDQELTYSFTITDNNLLCLASMVEKDKVDVWSLEDQKLLRSLPHRTCFQSIASKDNYLYVGESSGEVSAWEPATGKCLYTIHPSKNLPNNKRAVCCLEATDDLLIIGFGTGHISIVDRLTGTPKYKHPLFRAHTQEILNLYVQGTVLCMSSEDGTASTWDLITGTVSRTFKPNNGTLTYVAIQDNIVATALSNGIISIWNRESGKKIRDWETQAEKSCTTSLAIHDNRIYVRSLSRKMGICGSITAWEFRQTLPHESALSTSQT
jgi:hypothetical protein